MSLLLRNTLLTLGSLYFFMQAPNLFAQDANVTVSGIVYEMGNKKPFQAAIVSIREIESIAAVTETDGTFSLTLPGPGTYTVIATALGAANPETEILQLVAGVKPSRLTFYLRPATILPEVVVSAERNPRRFVQVLNQNACHSTCLFQDDTRAFARPIDASMPTHDDVSGFRFPYVKDRLGRSVKH